MSKRSESRPELWQARYSYAEVDYIAGVSKGTSKRWLAGYKYQGERGMVTLPPVTPHAVAAALSFIDLIEVAAIGRMKTAGFSLQKIRAIVTTCQSIFEIERPLATLRFKIGGGDAFVVNGDILVAVGGKRAGEQAWHDILRPFLEELDYDESGWARRWWPLGRDHVVVVDPDYAFGLPVVAGSGIRIETILERAKAGDLPDEIATDFNLSRHEVDRALQFELKRAA